ncbi:unnamed protein product [Tetraodon nigroviridis]|uniref:(spotted green pufferfish) hypothetical protein n=1 Tax=Tetraodon nigroviridis TaxID=99883 RepID=Q4RLQ9_TETNG|nr:unnamed protein product [Tetraodon nigroviridis]
MAEGGEGEDEIQFLRTVSTATPEESVRGSLFCMCARIATVGPSETWPASEMRSVSSSP